jgi:hypothetical protein
VEKTNCPPSPQPADEITFHIPVAEHGRCSTAAAGQDCPASDAPSEQIALGAQGVAESSAASLLHLLEFCEQASERSPVTMLETLARAFRAEAALLWRPDDASSEMYCARHWVATPERVLKPLVPILKLRLWPVEGLPGRVWATSQAEVMTEMAQDGHSDRSTTLAKLGIRTVVGIPIKSGIEVTGVVELLLKEDFTAAQITPTLAALLSDRLGMILPQTRGA